MMMTAAGAARDRDKERARTHGGGGGLERNYFRVKDDTATTATTKRNSERSTI